MSPTPFKIVSGGQTGVDRAALDAARALNIDHGGWCPKGRRAEDGRIPAAYQLQETSKRDYAFRTEQNVIDSDATLILFRQKLSGGTKLTQYLAQKHLRPQLRIDLQQASSPAQIDAARTAISDWIAEHQIKVLNVAGPRESTSKGITQQATEFLQLMFDHAIATGR